jgi:hypothetical protein
VFGETLALDIEEVQKTMPARFLLACIRQWLAEVGRQIGQHHEIDGKIQRGSFATAASRLPWQLVSAWASETRLILGQSAVDMKSNIHSACSRIRGC